MNKKVVARLGREFPFLGEVFRYDRAGEVPAQYGPEIKVKQVDRSLLRRIPTEFYWSGSLVSIEDRESVHFVLPGKILLDRVRRTGESGSNYAHSPYEKWEGETIISAIDRLGITPDYIVLSHREYDNTEGQEMVNRYEVTIFKIKDQKLIRDEISRLHWREMVQAEEAVNNE